MMQWLKDMFTEKEVVSEDRPYRDVDSLKLLEELKEGLMPLTDGHAMLNEILERLIRKEE